MSSQGHAPVDPIEIAAMEQIPFVVNWKRLQSLESQMKKMHGMVMKDEAYAAQTGGFGPDKWIWVFVVLARKR